jgi:hypothetical protein
MHLLGLTPFCQLAFVFGRSCEVRYATSEHIWFLSLSLSKKIQHHKLLIHPPNQWDIGQALCYCIQWTWICAFWSWFLYFKIYLLWIQHSITCGPLQEMFVAIHGWATGVRNPIDVALLLAKKSLCVSPLGRIPPMYVNFLCSFILVSIHSFKHTVVGKGVTRVFMQ